MFYFFWLRSKHKTHQANIVNYIFYGYVRWFSFEWKWNRAGITYIYVYTYIYALFFMSLGFCCLPMLLLLAGNQVREEGERDRHTFVLGFLFTGVPMSFFMGSLQILTPVSLFLVYQCCWLEEDGDLCSSLYTRSLLEWKWSWGHSEPRGSQIVQLFWVSIYKDSSGLGNSSWKAEWGCKSHRKYRVTL